MALLELQTMHSWKFMKRESTFATVADQRHVNMEVDFYDAEIIVPTDPPSSIAYLEKYDHGAALRRWKLTETGEPQIYSIAPHDFSSTSVAPLHRLHFFPLPDAVYNYTIEYDSFFKEIDESTKTQVVPVAPYALPLLNNLLMCMLFKFTKSSNSIRNEERTKMITNLSFAKEKDVGKNVGDSRIMPDPVLSNHRVVSRTSRMK